MLFINNIQSVAKYESKVLVRSWFFKIFTTLALLFLGFFIGVTLLAPDNGGAWKFKAIPSNIPYIALLLLNTGQAVIAIFLSSEFLKRDKKLDTSEVFYVHPLSNAEYVFGKIWGNLRVFLLLNLIIIAMVVLFNFLSPGADIDWFSYLSYLLIISIPTLVFIIGLSILLMLVLKNQALTFIILLGYIGLTLFYIGDKFYYLFDYMAYSLPLVKSSIIGFSNLETILNHRAIYLFAGLAFICFTISLFNRLPNSSRSSYPWIVLGVILFAVSGMSGYKHVQTFIGDVKIRQAYIAINNRYVHSPKMVIDQYHISLEQQANGIVSEVRMTGRPLETASVFTFCLNPGFRVEAITANGQPLSFKREEQILLVDFGETVTPTDSVSFRIKYSGQVNNTFCYLDIPDEPLRETHRRDLFNVDKKYCFQTSNYLLFTPENYWYPVPGTSYSNESPDWRQSYFSRFTLQITPLPGLTSVTQDEYFSPAIPLIIGNYKQVSLESDSTTYSAWYIDGHDYFIAPYDSILDTIPTLIREMRENMERTYKLDYPFNRFSVVEVPVQFYSYTRSWSQAQETVQPGMVLFPEKGWMFDQMDIEKRAKQQIKWARWGGNEINEKEAKQRTFNDFLNIFTRMEGNRNFSSVGRGNTEMTTQANPYFQFPQLYNFRYNIFSPEWPVANRMIELYLQNRVINDDWERNINGISNNEKANQLMGDFSFKELLSNVEYRDIMDNIIGLRGSRLFAFPEYQMGVTAFRDSLHSLLRQNTFRNIQFEHLLDTLGMISGTDIASQIAGWDKPALLPYYIIDLPEVTRYNNRGQETFVLKLSISNNSEVDGIVNVRTQVGGRSNTSNDDPRLNRQIPLAAHQSKQLISVWDEAPRDVVVNTLISQNLPNNIRLPIRNINREPGRPTEVEGDYTLPESTFALSGEVIVDNEDSLLFSLSEPGIVGLLPQWLDKVDDDTSFKYRGIPWWRPPLTWTLTTKAGYYGKYIRSAYVIKNGDGSQTATWKAPLSSPGHYEVYYWIFREDRRNDRQNNGEYHFKVMYDDEKEDTYINMRRAEDGWNLLGVYYVNSDTMQVVLSNDSKLRTVTADAVRVVKRQ